MTLRALTGGSSYGDYGQWDRPDPAQVLKDVDWQRWLSPAPRIPWKERRMARWDAVREEIV